MPVCAFALFMLGLLMVPSFNDSAHAQCALTICKESPDLPVPQNESEAVFFPFLILVNGVITEEFSLPANGPCSGGAFDGQIDVVEDSFPGWVLADVECSDSALIDVTFIENGVSLDCLGGTEITCTFTNVRGSVTNVPTLSEWGMIAVAGGLALVGVFFAVRRRKVHAA